MDQIELTYLTRIVKYGVNFRGAIFVVSLREQIARKAFTQPNRRILENYASSLVPSLSQQKIKPFALQTRERRAPGGENNHRAPAQAIASRL